MSKSLIIRVLFVYIILVAIEFLTILYLNNGIFTYTLDDAYIHLSLSENIAMGNYGINSNEFSSPSSSIIWPFILVPFAGLSFFNLIPLLLNIVITAISILLIIFFLNKYFLKEENVNSKVWFLFLTFFFLIIFNLVGLIFTGMEHSLQILMVILIASGLLKFTETKIIPNYLLFSIILGPLVRYENLAISLAALIFVFLSGRKKQAITLILIIFSLLSLFSVFLFLNSKEILPNSIIQKSIQFNNQSIISPIKNFLKSLKINEGLRLAFLMFAIIFLMFYRAEKLNNKNIAFVTIFAILLHMLFGQYGWFQRYEVYAWVFSFILFIYLIKYSLQDIFRPSWKNFIFLIVGSILFTHHYYYALLATPFASNNIYEQHYYMNRFVTEYYKDNVGVHDIGYVSFNNPYYVLDVNGLSNKKVVEFKKKWHRL